MTDPVDKIELALELAHSFCDKKVERVDINGMVFYRHNLRDVISEAVKQHKDRTQILKGVILTNSTTLSFPISSQEYPKEIHIIKYQHGLTEVRDTPNSYTQKYVRDENV